jgi:hypothetical protein
MPTIVTSPPADDDAALLRGSLVTLRRRCGKPNCRCAAGDPHETPALSYSMDGRTKTVTLREQDLADVEAGLARYQQAREALEAQALAGIQALTDRMAARRQQPRR